MSLLALKNVSKIYQQGGEEVKALHNVNITIEQGDFVAIVGASGSGKSTLMNLLGCLDFPTSGGYILNGVNVGTLSDHALSRIRNQEIGFIFQGFNLVTSLTALENVELPLLYRSKKMEVFKRNIRERALRALEKVSLENRIHHRPGQMSGGQQQRVAIARALAADPSILLADEPTGNLDTRSGSEVMRVLHTLHKAGKTIVLITHDDLIAQQASRLIRVSDGQVVEDRRLQPLL